MEGEHIIIYGYARVSTKGQAKDGNSLEAQENVLRVAGAAEVYTDAFTGTKSRRPELDKLLAVMQPGDTLKVTKLDRIARSATQGIEFVYTQVTKTGVYRGGQSLGSGFPIGASSIPVGTRFSAGKSSVLYLCFRLALERGWRRHLRHRQNEADRHFSAAVRVGGFCDNGVDTNVGFLRNKIL